ncbi:Ltp family lipoprotein [Microbacterium sp. NPDC056003]|uniref:Ltp family lipoprotein n=1 Tax=Microbacterium sp. NPDC056003 TaxID=3345676 RepID=UPI0035D62A9B
MSDNTHLSPELPPAGWYPDPHDSNGQRYWDGGQWTVHAAPADAASAGAAAVAAASASGVTALDAVPSEVDGGGSVAAKRGLPKLRWWQWALIVCGVLVLISIIANGVNGDRASSDDEPARPVADSVKPAEEVEAPSAAPIETVEVPDLVGSTIAEARAALDAVGLALVPGDVADDWVVTAQEPTAGEHPLEGLELSVTSEASKPVYTLAQQNAIGKAQDYLEYSGFSRSGLIDQLEYEGYSTEEATFGADNAGADWNAEAAEKAADYLEFSSFSRQGLYDQLAYEGFTDAEIQFGLKAVGY